MLHSQRRICSCESTAIFWSETSLLITFGSFSIPCHCGNGTFSHVTCISGNDHCRFSCNNQIPQHIYFHRKVFFQQISVSWFIITINNHGHTYWLLQSCFHQVKVVFMLGLAGDDELEDEGEAEQRNRYCPCHHQFCYQCFLDMFFGCVTLKVRKPSVADIIMFLIFIFTIVLKGFHVKL